jgi:hypothetical protein
MVSNLSEKDLNEYKIVELFFANSLIRINFALLKTQGKESSVRERFLGVKKNNE